MVLKGAGVPLVGIVSGGRTVGTTFSVVPSELAVLILFVVSPVTFDKFGVVVVTMSDVVAFEDDENREITSSDELIPSVDVIVARLWPCVTV